MSRSNKPRTGTWRGHGGGHSYRKGHHGWYKRTGNKWMRQNVRQRLKDVLFGDAYDEKKLPDNKEELYDRWWCC